MTSWDLGPPERRASAKKCPAGKVDVQNSARHSEYDFLVGRHLPPLDESRMD